jgi:hypothetical protein
VFVQTPANRATFTPPTTNQVTAGVVQPRAPRQASARARNRLTAIGGPSSLPPVNVVPSTPRGPLDSVVVTSAARPPLPALRGGFIMAAPGGTGGGGRSGGAGGARSGSSATATPIGADSNRVIRGGRGGRGVLIPRPDTTASPR